ALLDTSPSVATLPTPPAPAPLSSSDCPSWSSHFSAFLPTHYCPGTSLPNSPTACLRQTDSYPLLSLTQLYAPLSQPPPVSCRAVSLPPAQKGQLILQPPGRSSLRLA